MGALTEIEIFDCMYDSLKAAASLAEDLAKLPAQGPTYQQFREKMLLIEGTCRQACAWREDSRWLYVGQQIAEALARTGNWLRGYRVEGTMGKVFVARDLYLLLADNLRGTAKAIECLRHNATGVRGMILPETPHISRTESRPVQVLAPDNEARSPGGIILTA